MKMEFIIPVEIVSEANSRGHWAKKYSRARYQRDMAYANCLKFLGCSRDGYREGSYRVTLTRVRAKGQRNFDGDNLQSGFKAIRDGIAQYMGIDDGSDRLEWRYRQENGGEYRGMVVVGIERLALAGE